jgi:hypothetical protein
LFSKDFWYNWSPNLENPGLGDYLVFLVKQLFFGLLFITPFVAVGSGSLGLVIWSGASEEQARITWMVNAQRPLRAGILFTVFIIIEEFVLDFLATYLRSGLEEAVSFSPSDFLPEMMHSLMFLIGFILLIRGVSAFRAWIVCVSIHSSYNAVVTYTDLI